MQWLNGRVLDSRLRGRGFEPYRHHCVVSLSNNINPSSVLVQPRKTRPFITERLLMGRKESNQTNKYPNLNSVSDKEQVKDKKKTSSAEEGEIEVLQRYVCKSSMQQTTNFATSFLIFSKN